MRQNLLILVETFARGGLETHIAGEVHALTALGHTVHLAAGVLASDAILPKELAGTLVGLDIGPTAPPPMIERAVEQLVTYIRQHAITAVHAHPFTSNLAGFLAAGETGLPFIFSLHGPISLSAQYGPIYTQLLRRIVMPCASLVVCVSQEVATLARLGGTAGRTVVIPNAVAFPAEPAPGDARAGRAAMVARLDHDKVPGLLDFIAKCGQAGVEEIDIYGGGSASSALDDSSLPGAGPRPNIRRKGWNYDLAADLDGYEFVAGMGRVILEGAAAARPVILVGYDGVKGLLDKEAFGLAAHWNFSGRGMATIDADQLAAQIAESRRDPARFMLRPLVEARFSERVAWSRFADRLADSPPVDGDVTRMLRDAIRNLEDAQIPLLQNPAFARILDDTTGESADTARIRELEETLTRETATLSGELADARGALRLAQTALDELRLDEKDFTALEDALFKLRTLSRTSGWRVAKTLQFINSERLRKRTRSGIGKVVGRVLLKRPIGMHDAVADSVSLISNWRSNLLDRFDRARLIASTSPARRIVGEHHRLESSSLSGLPSGPASPSCGIEGLVSIILPVYNHASLLPEALDGILAQDYPLFEVIVVNDGSKDDFEGAVAPYLADRRIRVYTQPNQGLPSALNNGFAQARGSYLTWTSADNVMLPHQIRRLVEALDAHREAGLVYSDYEAIDDRGAPLADPDWRRHNRSPGSSSIRLPGEVTIENFHDSGDNFLGASFLWRADVHAVVGSHDENTFGGEDYDFWLRMHLVTPFVHLPEVLYRYRVHDNTLNAKAKELNLFDTVRRLLARNRERLDTVLAKRALATNTVGGFWRDPAQYDESVRLDVDLLRYTQVAADPLAANASDKIRVVVVDVPFRLIDPALLERADIVVASQLAHGWIRDLNLPRHIRIFAGEVASLMPAIQHTAAHLRFERDLAARGHVLSVKPPARRLAQQTPRHVLMLINCWRVGGMEQVMLELASGFAAKGIKITLASAEEPLHDELRRVADAYRFSVAAFDHDAEALLDFVRRNGVDLVHYHHCTLGAAELAEARVPTVYTFHNSYVWFDEVKRQALRQALRHVTATVAVSRQVAAYAERWFGVDSKRLFVIPNGTSLEGAAARHAAGTAASSFKLPPGAFGFLNVATFNRVKLQDRLVRAFAQVVAEMPEARLTICGHPADREYHDQVRSLCRELDLEGKVTMISDAGRADVLALLKTHHCFVLASMVEGWSISLLEALLSGTPVLTTDVGSARDLAANSGGVTLVPALANPLEAMGNQRLWDVLLKPSPGFERNLAQGMLRVRRDHAVLTAEVRRSGAHLGEVYSAAQMAEHYLDAFREIRTFDHRHMQEQ